jgi:hypothetical protein
MDKEGFEKYLKRGGRTQSAVNRCIRFVSEFEDYLEESKKDKHLSEVRDEDLMDFVYLLDQESRTRAKGYLWAIRYYYDYLSNDEIRDLAGRLRAQRIKKSPFSLKDFRGVNPAHVEKLAKVGIRNGNQMLKSGRTEDDRKVLSKQTGIPEKYILEFVKLSDLARIPGVKGIRARLYYDAGIDTVEKMATWDPEELREKIVTFAEETGFEGIPTLPAEARFSVETAKKLPKVVEY